MDDMLLCSSFKFLSARLSLADRFLVNAVLLLVNAVDGLGGWVGNLSLKGGLSDGHLPRVDQVDQLMTPFVVNWRISSH